jgi:glycolate oxidase FAD binding subunit
MTKLSLLTDQLHAAAPQTELLTSSGDLKRFAVDGVKPQVVALPGVVDDVAALLNIASERHLAVLPVGGCTELELGQPPERYDLAICTVRLNALLEHEAADLTCSVQAGMPLAALQQYLTAKGQFLALDPPNAERATIGGILAANASGPQRLRYGAARDLVIGLRVALGDGTIARSGGKVVKNVAGYDLNKLYIGSLGTLGIIVEANFKLIPRPERQETLLVSFENAPAAMETVIALLSSVVTPTAIELLDPAAQRHLSEQATCWRSPFPAVLRLSLASLPIPAQPRHATLAAQAIILRMQRTTLSGPLFAPSRSGRLSVKSRCSSTSLPLSWPMRKPFARSSSLKPAPSPTQAAG